MKAKAIMHTAFSKTWLFIGLLTLGISGTITSVSAQASTAPAGTILPDGFTKLPDGLEYKIVSHGTGKRKPDLSDHIELHVMYRIGDSVMFDSRRANNNRVVSIPMAQPKGTGDPAQVIREMVAGDSAIARFPTDSLKKEGRAPVWAKDGDMLIYDIKLVSVLTEKEFKDQEAAVAARQNTIDEAALQDYFKAHGLKPNRTASGLYYSVAKAGTGETIKQGQKIGVNYTGKFLSGKIFDSNIDTAFHHQQLFTLEVGKGRVIRGWDEGLQLLKPGSKATFYIPSSLAYGAHDRQGIPANSILIFDVETAEIPDPAKVDDGIIKAYLAKNNIQATKTASGLYYIITKNGLGETAQPGAKVTVNYTGKTLDGKVFDSNVDVSFNHPQPFTFALGQGQVIKGWDEGVQLLKLGSKATFFIPSGLAYGEQGAGTAIPPNTILAFDVEVTGIDK